MGTKEYGLAFVLGLSFFSSRDINMDISEEGINERRINMRRKIYIVSIFVIAFIITGCSLAYSVARYKNETTIYDIMDTYAEETGMYYIGVVDIHDGDINKSVLSAVDLDPDMDSYCFYLTRLIDVDIYGMSVYDESKNIMYRFTFGLK